MAFLAGLRKGDGYRITAMVYIRKCKKCLYNISANVWLTFRKGPSASVNRDFIRIVGLFCAFC